MLRTCLLNHYVSSTPVNLNRQQCVIFVDFCEPMFPVKKLFLKSVTSCILTDDEKSLKCTFLVMHIMDSLKEIIKVTGIYKNCLFTYLEIMNRILL